MSSSSEDRRAVRAHEKRYGGRHGGGGMRVQAQGQQIRSTDKLLDDEAMQAIAGLAGRCRLRRLACESPPFLVGFLTPAHEHDASTCRCPQGCFLQVGLASLQVNLHLLASLDI
jgi:hypothetical protein